MANQFQLTIYPFVEYILRLTQRKMNYPAQLPYELKYFWLTLLSGEGYMKCQCSKCIAVNDIYEDEVEARKLPLSSTNNHYCLICILGKCAVVKTSTRQTYFLPVIGLVDPENLKPGDLVGVNKDSYLILETLPAEYDARVKAMEVDERPTEQYSDIGGLDTQIQELIEAIVLPMTHKERFERLGK